MLINLLLLCFIVNLKSETLTFFRSRAELTPKCLRSSLSGPCSLDLLWSWSVWVWNTWSVCSVSFHSVHTALESGFLIFLFLRNLNITTFLSVFTVMNQRHISHLLFLTPRLPGFLIRRRLNRHALELLQLDRALSRLGMHQLSDSELRQVGHSGSFR